MSARSTDRDFPVPPFLAGRAAAWAAGERPEVVPARPAASVVLTRGSPGAGAREVFVLRRASSMAFAPDVVAFPGGGVDPRDADTDPPWQGPDASVWARRLGVPDVALARAVVVAAARELFEECGVLLAGPDAGAVVPDVTGPGWREERDALLARECSFGELLTRRGLVLRTDLLRPRARWVTPACEPRRYDTFFFAAAVPGSQRPDDRTSEATSAGWADPAALLADDTLLLPPTRVVLEQVVAAGTDLADLADVAESGAALRPVEPEPVTVDGAVLLRARIPVTP